LLYYGTGGGRRDFGAGGAAFSVVRLLLFSAALALALIARAAAQDVTGIPNADVTPGYRSLALRSSFTPASDGRPSFFAQQFAYQHNFGSKFSVQSGVNFGKRGPQDYEFTGLQAIAQWQFVESEEAGGDGSLLLIGRMPDDGDGPGRAAAVVAGKWIRDDWELRAALASFREFGERAQDGFGVNLRIETTRRVATLGRLGAQLSQGVNTAHFGAFSDQNHQAGVVAKTLLWDHLMVNSTTLFGVSDAAPDLEAKLFLTYEF